MSNNKKITDQNLKEQFVKECILLDPEKEYPGYTGSEKCFIVTDLSEDEIERKYGAFLFKLSPFLLLDKTFLAARNTYRRNYNKHKMRAYRTEDIFGYVDSTTEIHNKKLVVNSLFVEYETREKAREIELALDSLTETQKRRIVMRFYECRTYEEIAETEGVSINAVIDSIERGLNILRKTNVAL